MENNDINQLLNDIIKKTENSSNCNDDDTSSQARQLLQSWANNTETFKTNKTKNESIPTKVTKTCKYRKLDAPMMVAKKITNRPSVDPTLIMEARLAHVKEMKAKRIERMESKSNSSVSSKSQASSVVSVDIPDIDAEINLHRMKVAERMKEKQKELDERSRRAQKNKVIDENMALLFAQENEIKIKAEKDFNENELEKINCAIRSFSKIQSLLRKRTFFAKWVFECNFETKTYQKADKLNHFRKKSSYFSFWKKQFRKRQQEKEVSYLERQLRHEKQLEMIADQKYTSLILRKSLLKWKIKYKTLIEFRVIEEQHKKRRAFVTSRIDFEQIETNSVEEIEEPKKVETKVLKAPKTKIKKLKTIPKFEAMTKRMEEQKIKKLEKAQKEAEEIALNEEKSLKHKMEIQRKKKEEHRQFLEQEKLKRDGIKRKQEKYQRNAERKKYCEQVSEDFRIKRLKMNQFVKWKKILTIKNEFESIAETHYINHLLSTSIKAFIKFAKDSQNKRDQICIANYNNFILRKSFFYWSSEFSKFQNYEIQVTKISNQWRLRRALHILYIQKQKSRKSKYAMAARHANKVLLRKFFKAWPIGCAVLMEEEERESNRQDLMTKALQLLQEINSDDFDED